MIRILAGDSPARLDFRFSTILKNVSLGLYFTEEFKKDFTVVGWNDRNQDVLFIDEDGIGYWAYDAGTLVSTKEFPGDILEQMMQIQNETEQS